MSMPWATNGPMGRPAPEPSEDAMMLIGLQNLENEAISVENVEGVLKCLSVVSACKSFIER